jgi:recombinational DNA repair ATPase RecF
MLAQLNALCREPTPDGAELEACQTQIASTDREIAGNCYGLLFGRPDLRLRLRGILDSDEGDVPGAETPHVRALRAARPQAIRRGYVTKAAHRERFERYLSGREIETHSWQGQRKGAYDAWQLAEGDIMHEKTGERPLWLAEDPFNEMDRSRALRPRGPFCDREQVILTSPRDADLDLETRGFARRLVHDGVIEDGG